MKENKSDIVRIHDDAPIGPAAARDASGSIPQDVGTSQAEPPGKENVKDRSIYGGDTPINLKFPLCFHDVWFGYIEFPVVVLMFIAFSCGAWASIFKQLLCGEPADRAG